MDKSIILKDGIIVIRKALVLNVNKNRRYQIIVGNKRVASNLLYSDLLYYLKVVRSK